MAPDQPIRGTYTDVPARLDRLPWSRFHRLVVVALGITWILDGLEVTLAGSVAAALQTSPRLHLTAEQVGLTGSAYLAGAVLGSLFFGHLTDRLGRKKLFNVTLGVYLVATALTAFSWDFWSFLFFRFLTGAGIGGEYSAINSAIQELIPARLRGRVDLAINGSFWLGAAGGALLSVWLLDPDCARPRHGLARRLRQRRRARPGDPLPAPLPARESALADAARPAGRGGARRRRDRGARRRQRRRDPAAGDAAAGAGRHASHDHAVGGAHAAARLSRPHHARPRADGGAGLHLQRHLLHLRPGADALLRHRGRQGRALHPAVRHRQFPGAVAARPVVRFGGPQDR